MAKNPHVSTVSTVSTDITGASKLSQRQSNLGALQVLGKPAPEVMAHVDAITQPLAE